MKVAGIPKTAALGYLVAAAASTAMVCIGMFFMIVEARKKPEERLQMWIILGIVMSVLGGVLLLGIIVIFMMSGLGNRMDIGLLYKGTESGSGVDPNKAAPVAQSGGRSRRTCKGGMRAQ